MSLKIDIKCVRCRRPLKADQAAGGGFDAIFEVHPCQWCEGKTRNEATLDAMAAECEAEEREGH